jgi:hypothetical protein
VNKYLSIIKAYWEYSIIIVPYISLLILSETSVIREIVPHAGVLHQFGLISVLFFACLLITNIRHENETKEQLFFCYLRIGFILPTVSLIFFLMHIVVAGSHTDDLFWAVVAASIMATITVPASIAIGYLIRFIMTVRSTSTFYSRKLRITTVLFISILIVIWSLTGGYVDSIDAKKELKEADSIDEISFSPDGKKIIFNRRKGESPNFIHTYDLETSEMVQYQSPVGEIWSMARYSFDGGEIVFVTVPRGKKYIEHDKAQLAVMDTDGSNVRIITNTDAYRACPSFSHSGRNIIFSRSDVIRISNRTRAGGYDVYEMDVKTGQETRLTYFKFLGT